MNEFDGTRYLELLTAIEDLENIYAELMDCHGHVTESMREMSITAIAEALKLLKAEV